MLAEHGPAHYIKIDVEGLEVNVLNRLIQASAVLVVRSQFAGISPRDIGVHSAPRVDKPRCRIQLRYPVQVGDTKLVRRSKFQRVADINGLAVFGSLGEESLVRAQLGS